VFEDFRYEYRAEPTVGGEIQNFLGLGIGKSFELDLRDFRPAGGQSVNTLDLSYNLISAFPGGVAPGVSFGVQDAANVTPDGRRFFAVTTFRNTMDEISGNVYADITLGFQVGSLTSPFVGVSVPFTSHLYLLAEDNGFRINAGLEFRPSSRMALRFIVREQRTLLSLSATSRF